MAYVGPLSKTSSDQRHLRPSSYGYNSSLPPHPPPSPFLCPLCFLPFNPAITATCPNCFYHPPSLLPLPSHQHHLQSNKRSNSSLSSSGSSSSSITSPSEIPSDSFMMSSMMGVVDDILREETSPICRHCNQAEPPLLFCLDCKEHLCLYCTPHHQKDHHIVKTHPSFPYKEMSPISPPPPSSKSLAPSDTCLQHLGEPLLYFCRPCLATICYKCIDGDHKSHQYAPIAESFQKMQPSMDEIALAVPHQLSLLKHSSQNFERARADILRKKNEMSSNIHQIFHQLHEAIRKRELEILARIETITATRLGSLDKEKDKISLDIRSLSELSSQMKEAKEKEQLAALVMTHCKLGKELERIASNTKQQAIEDESLFAMQNQSSIQTAINDFCKLTTAPYPPLCSASGEGLLHPRVNKPVTLTVFTKDRLGEPCTEGGETTLVASLNQKTGGGGGGVTVRDNKDGTYLLSFKPQSCGNQYLSITIRGHHIQGSPFQLLVDGRREYNHFGSVSVVFGSEGSKPGQFCRPWGICADHKGNVIIGDRSNHRIQVFDSNGAFSHAFGSEGSHPGQFNRPAGVAVTKEGDIVVADKDNHRIQKFQLNGKLMHHFGSRGSNDDQMVYPYDVAVHQIDGRIVVTDTGNHRILIFTPDGSLLGKFGYKGYLCGHFDSPRGIVITNEGQIAVSDFNVHHLLVIEPNGTQARILGSHGSGNAQFTRPQGIAIDQMGNFVVADTKNNRIVVMSPGGQFLAKFGSAGKARGQFDRPTSVTVLPDGRVAVLDFGNSRVQIF